MSAHRLLQDLAEAPYEALQDPGTGNTIQLDRSLGSCRLAVGASSETRKLATPLRAGLFITIGCTTCGGGTAALTVNGTYDGTNSVITFSAAAQFVFLMSIGTSATGYQWRVIGNVGVTGTGLTAPTSLTDSSGGTPSTTLAAITAGASYAQADMVAAKNAIASLNAQINNVLTYLAK